MNQLGPISREIAAVDDAAGALARRRFQLLGTLLIEALLPFVLPGPFLPGTPFEPAPINALMANGMAVVIAIWTRLSTETYPGNRSSFVILSAALTADAILVAVLLATRLPYDRFALGSGFIFHVLWNYNIYFRVERRIRRRIAVVPFGDVAQLLRIEGVDWQMLDQPEVAATLGHHAIVADFSADLPAEWEAFLADAALHGKIVYQVKQLSESLTGRVELGHLSENSFGSLLPARGYF